MVVPLARDESDSLTLREWRLLLGSRRVFFEHADHPLRPLLDEVGAATAGLARELRATDDGYALVADPWSARVVSLARAGAEVTSGVAGAPDPLSAAHAAPVVRRATRSLGSLAVTMARLRSEDGCPWDREQTHQSLVVHLLEEAYEVAETIESGGPDADLAEELGDLLLQVAFHSRLAEQEGRFDLAEVAEAIVAKLVHRHPHVFGNLEVSGAGEVLRNWEAIKATEKNREGPFDGLPTAGPALSLAAKTQKRAAALGFAPDGGRSLDEARQALGAGRLGDALFWTVALARARGEDAEGALRRALASFRRRWERPERE